MVLKNGGLIRSVMFRTFSEGEKYFTIEIEFDEVVWVVRIWSLRPDLGLNFTGQNFVEVDG
jgi:hypothetical protein